MKYLLIFLYLFFLAGCCIQDGCFYRAYDEQRIFNTFKYQDKIYTTSKVVKWIVERNATDGIETYADKGKTISNIKLFTLDDDTKKWVPIANKDLNQSIEIFLNDYNNIEIEKLLEQDMLSIKYGYYHDISGYKNKPPMLNIAQKIQEDDPKGHRYYVRLFKNQTEWDGGSYFVASEHEWPNVRYYYATSYNNEVTIEYLTDTTTLLGPQKDLLEDSLNAWFLKVPSFDGKCNVQIFDKCVNENNGTFSYTTITDFYSQKLLDLSAQFGFPEDVQETPTSIFDEKGNLHAFYHKKGDKSSEHYMWYGYFTKENPSEPLYEQKVYW